MTDHLRHALIMLASGIGIPLLATLNAQLGGRIASPVAAAIVLFSVAFLACLLVGLVTGLGGLARLPGQPLHLFAGGLFVAFYVVSVTFIAPKFGVGNAIFFVLIGQLISAAVIDQFGLFGARQQSLTLARGAGIALMGLGVLLTQKV
ncbi:DMT family transporter [Oceaniglobus roseus]|uniref:DMT family transporter n=1 Tax=Oceaniglobus roseus TaxID=1737570 RepID=UPI000C7F18A2|nr:DMT family transporter [Kandeliimicrobium roseum]